MSNEFNVLTADDQGYILEKVDFLMAAFEKLRAKEVDQKGQDGRLKNIDEIRQMLSQWGPSEKITVPDEQCIARSFGLFREAINICSQEKRTRPKTAEELDRIFQKFKPEKN